MADPISVVANVAALKAINVINAVDGQVFETRGYHSNGDGGQGLYFYSAASNTPDNGGTVIAPAVGAGRYLLLLNGVLNVKQFGARGDANTDDTAAIRNALAAVVEDTTPVTYPFGGTYGSTVYLPPGQYNISGTLFPKRGTVLTGDSRASAVINLTVINTTAILYYKQGSSNVGNDFCIQNLTVKTDSNNWVPTAGAGVRIAAAYSEGTVDAYDASGPTVTLTLGSGASSVDDIYKGKHIFINRDAKNSATITAYNGTTKVATLDGPLPIAAVPGDTYHIYGSGQNNILVNNITVYGPFYDGLWVEACGISNLHRVRVALAQRYGIRVQDTLRVTSTSLNLTECYSSNSGSHGYYFDNLRYCSLTSCAADGNAGDAYAMHTCQQVVMSGCGAESNTGSALSLNGCFGITQVSCKYEGCGTHVIALTSSGANVAIGCIFNPTPQIKNAVNAVRIVTPSGNTSQGNNIICLGCDSTATAFTNNWSVVTTIQSNSGSSSNSGTNIGGTFRFGAGPSGAQGHSLTRIKHGTAVLGTGPQAGPGTVTVPELQVTAHSIIQLTAHTPGGTPGALYVSARSPFDSFTIKSTSDTDTSTVGWVLFEP